ncbi:MAG: B12-binding domain-containing radical SAM protein [Elusimicrobia bacterium]|nr:B12-binding domain-containing radical SAM protein [Elusimicrobiota bacterium]
MSSSVDFVLVRTRNHPDPEFFTPEEFRNVASEARQFPPFGILNIQSYLRKHGFTTKVLDRFRPEYHGLSAEEFAGIIRGFRPRFIGFSSLTSQADDAAAIARALKGRTDAKVVLGGVHFSALFKAGLEVADYVVVGDGEVACLKLCRGEAPASGLIVGETLDDLDEVPRPTREELDETAWSPKESARFKINTARGCPFDCYFCKDGVRDSAVRMHSVEYVADYFKFVVDTYGLTEFYVLDDIFLPNPERLEAYIRAFAERKIKVDIKCFLHPNTVKPNLLPLYKELGVRVVSLGIESGSNDILRKMGKRITTDVARQAVDDLHRFGFETNGLFMLGHREETEETMRQTVEFVRELSPKLSSFWVSFMAPYPGTPMYDAGIDTYGKILNPDYSKWGNRYPVFLPKGLTYDQLMEARRHLLFVRRDLEKRKVVASKGYARYYLQSARTKVKRLANGVRRLVRA